jgi:hypothetical protein
VEDPKVNTVDLLNRARAYRARPRAVVEAEIALRHAEFTKTTDAVLHEWE